MRCIFLLAESEKIDEIQALRQGLDPLASKVPPHITVVFPFNRPIRLRDLEALLPSVGPWLPIQFALGPPTTMGNSMVFTLTQGRREIVSLHEHLHACLPADLRPISPFLPHLTFGRDSKDLKTRDHLAQARNLLPFYGMARKLVLERIGDNNESIVEIEISND